MQGLAFVRFTRELSLWDPETFVRTVLVEWLHVSEVWVGANFLFGHERAGTFSVLRTLGSRYGFRAEKIDPIRYKDFVVSSTRVRRLVSEGRVDEAAALLGHHYFLDGTVVRGAGRGRSIGVPTANLATPNDLVPPAGVYATLATVDGIVLPAVTNIGMRPTFGDVDAPVIETHVLDTDRDLYDRQRAPALRAATARRAAVPRCGRVARADRRRHPQCAQAVRPHFAIESFYMTETAGAVQNGFVLRMSVPASGELGALGPELGAKLAEQLGVAPAGAADGRRGDGRACRWPRYRARHLVRVPQGRPRVAHRGPTGRDDADAPPYR